MATSVVEKWTKGSVLLDEGRRRRARCKEMLMMEHGQLMSAARLDNV